MAEEVRHHARCREDGDDDRWPAPAASRRSLTPAGSPHIQCRAPSWRYSRGSATAQPYNRVPAHPATARCFRACSRAGGDRAAVALCQERLPGILAILGWRSWWMRVMKLANLRSRMHILSTCLQPSLPASLSPAFAPLHHTYPHLANCLPIEGSTSSKCTAKATKTGLGGC